MKHIGRGWVFGLLPLVFCLLGLPVRGQDGFTADEYRLLPVRVHLLRSKTVAELNCALTADDARRILGKVNGIWRPAGLQFYAESILEEAPAAEELYAGLGRNRTEGHLRLVRPRASRSEELFHVYYLGEMRPNGICLEGSYQQIFVKEASRLRRVPGGIDEPLPRVTAHEIGHGLDLEHRQDRTNLMASGTTGTELNAAEIETARRAAGEFSFSFQPEAALALASRRRQEKRPADAEALYRVLAELPQGEVSAAARRRLRD